MVEAALKANGAELDQKHLQVDRSQGNTERNTKLAVFVGNLAFGMCIYVSLKLVVACLQYLSLTLSCLVSIFTSLSKYIPHFIAAISSEKDRPLRGAEEHLAVACVAITYSSNNENNSFKFLGNFWKRIEL